MDLLFSQLNFNSLENLPGYEARAAFAVNSFSVFNEGVDNVPTIVDVHSYVPWGCDNQMPFDLLTIVEKYETLAYQFCRNLWGGTMRDFFTFFVLSNIFLYLCNNLVLGGYFQPLAKNLKSESLWNV